MRGHGSGIEAEINYAYIWDFNAAGKVVRCKSYVDPATALGIAGLAAEP